MLKFWIENDHTLDVYCTCNRKGSIICLQESVRDLIASTSARDREEMSSLNSEQRYRAYAKFTVHYSKPNRKEISRSGDYSLSEMIADIYGAHPLLLRSELMDSESPSQRRHEKFTRERSKDEATLTTQ